MKYFDWNETKNEELRIRRKLIFEDVLVAIEGAGLLGVLEHPNQKNIQIRLTQKDVTKIKAMAARHGLQGFWHDATV